MDEKTSVVTPERFSSGFTYNDYIAQIKVNSDRFEQYYQSVEVSQDDADFFKKAVEAGVTKILVLGEDWCPDVYRGMPVMARISEASGMEIRVFPRDENLDIMNEFLNQTASFSPSPPWFSTPTTMTTWVTGLSGPQRQMKSGRR